jgi:hypothetical protein
MTPSRTSLRERMKGWMSRPAATVLTCMPGCWDMRTAVSLNTVLYVWNLRGPARAIVTHPHSVR